jgi:molybdopterin synthase catalytic subunit
MRIEIRETPFDPMEELVRYRDNLTPGSYGATASFIGAMRDHNEGDHVQAMTLEHYSGMTERHLRQIVEQAQRRWSFLEALVIHRVGELRPDDPIVLVAVWSTHRAAAFDACRFIMEALKSQAPFWKKEILLNGQRWVEKNTAG